MLTFAFCKMVSLNNSTMALDLHNIIAGLKLPEHDWNARCIALLPISTDANSSHGVVHFVDANGNQMSSFTKDTWGITIGDCYTYCNTQSLPYVSWFLSTYISTKLWVKWKLGCDACVNRQYSGNSISTSVYSLLHSQTSCSHG